MTTNLKVNTLNIAEKTIGPGHPCMIIAEAGVNHNGSEKRALDLVDVAHDAGADAVKFQTWKTELLVTMDAAKANYQETNTGSDESQYEMLKKLSYKGVTDKIKAWEYELK